MEGGEEGVGDWGDERSVNEGAVMLEAGSPLQYFTTATEMADPLLWRWLATWSTL